MIKINNSYLDRFKVSNNEYLFPLKNGIYLAFNKDDLTYKGVQFLYSTYYKNSSEDELLNRLITIGYLEITD